MAVWRMPPQGSAVYSAAAVILRNSEVARFTDDGYLGIGITPTEELHVYAASTPTIGIEDSTGQWDVTVSSGDLYVEPQDAEADLYFRDYGNASTMVLDNSANRVAIGAGHSTPDGTLHVHASTAGSVTAGGTADDLTVEKNAAGGMSILTPDASNSTILMGSPGDNSGAQIRWNYDAALLSIGSAVASAELVLKSGNFAERVRVHDDGLTMTSGAVSSPFQNVTLGAAAATFAVTSNNVNLTGNAGGNALTTITGGRDGMAICIISKDALVSLVHNGGFAANTFHLQEAFGEVAYESIVLVHDGTSWHERSRKAVRDYGGISVVQNTSQTVISTAGVAVQFVHFDTNDPASGMTPDHTNDHITIGKTGDYIIISSITVNSVTGSSSRFELTVQKNNGATIVAPLHVDRNIGGGGSQAGSASMSGMATLTKGDTLELWIENETNTKNYVLEDVTLSTLLVKRS